MYFFDIIWRSDRKTYKKTHYKIQSASAEHINMMH